MYYDKRTCTDKRTYTRRSYQIDCTLGNGFGDIKCQTVDESNMGLGVLINETPPFEIGDKLFVYIMLQCSWAEVRWINKEVNSNSSRVGLKCFSTFI